MSPGVLARTSRRGALVLLCAGLAAIVMVAVIKDLNQKLGVMTASNQGYQRMTDKQAEDIKKLQDTLRDEKEHHAMDMKDWKSKESAMKKRQDQGAKSLEVRMESMQSELHSLQSSHDNLQAELESSGQATAQLGAKVDRLQEEVSRCSSEKEALEQQMSHLAAERDSFKNQYLALFKQHQKSADSLQTLENEKSRLQLKLDDIKRTTSKDGGGPKASSSNPHQLREPMLVRALPASSSTRKSAVVNNRNLNIEQPFHPGHPAAVVSSSTPAAQSKVLAPVAAEPPLQRNVKPQQQLLRRHEVQKEDVMEAPQVLHHQEFNDFFHNSHGAALQQPLDRPQQQQQHFLPHQVLHHQQQHQAQQQHQGLFLRQQQHNFERPDAVRFQRREVDSIGRQQPPGDNLDEMIDGAKLAHPDLTGEEEEEEDDADDGQLQFDHPLGRVADHNNDDDFVYNDENQHYNNQPKQREDQIKPADFGIRQASNGGGIDHGLRRFRQQQPQNIFNGNNVRYFVQPQVDKRSGGGGIHHYHL